MAFLKSLFITLAGGIIIFLLASVAARADDYHIIDLRELSLDYKNYAMVNSNARNSLLYPEPPKESVNININMDLAKYLYWDNVVETYTTDAQYRSIGLQLRLGLRLSEYLELGYYHHSQHLIDRSHSYMDKYPVEDAVQIKLFLYRSDKRESLF